MTQTNPEKRRETYLELALKETGKISAALELARIAESFVTGVNGTSAPGPSEDSYDKVSEGDIDEPLIDEIKRWPREIAKKTAESLGEAFKDAKPGPAFPEGGGLGDSGTKVPVLGNGAREAYVPVKRGKDGMYEVRLANGGVVRGPVPPMVPADFCVTREQAARTQKQDLERERLDEERPAPRPPGVSPRLRAEIEAMAADEAEAAPETPEEAPAPPCEPEPAASKAKEGVDQEPDKPTPAIILGREPKGPWFRNHYRCDHCDITWQDEWSCTSNDRCPECNYEIEPHDSDELIPGPEEEPTPAESAPADEQSQFAENANRPAAGAPKIKPHAAPKVTDAVILEAVEAMGGRDLKRKDVFAHIAAAVGVSKDNTVMKATWGALVDEGKIVRFYRESRNEVWYALPGHVPEDVQKQQVMQRRCQADGCNALFETDDLEQIRCAMCAHDGRPVRDADWSAGRLH